MSRITLRSDAPGFESGPEIEDTFYTLLFEGECGDPCQAGSAPVVRASPSTAERLVARVGAESNAGAWFIASTEIRPDDAIPDGVLVYEVG